MGPLFRPAEKLNRPSIDHQRRVFQRPGTQGFKRALFPGRGSKELRPTLAHGNELAPRIGVPQVPWNSVEGSLSPKPELKHRGEMRGQFALYPGFVLKMDGMVLDPDSGSGVEVFILRRQGEPSRFRSATSPGRRRGGSELEQRPDSAVRDRIVVESRPDCGRLPLRLHQDHVAGDRNVDSIRCRAGCFLYNCVWTDLAASRSCRCRRCPGAGPERGGQAGTDDCSPGDHCSRGKAPDHEEHRHRRRGNDPEQAGRGGRAHPCDHSSGRHPESGEHGDRQRGHRRALQESRRQGCRGHRKDGRRENLMLDKGTGTPGEASRLKEPESQRAQEMDADSDADQGIAEPCRQPGSGLHVEILTPPGR